MSEMNIIQELQEFIECEGKSCSFGSEVIVVHGSWLMVHDYD